MGATTDLFAGILPFFHVAQERSFRRAATRLGVTTAAVSKAVRKLEADLGVALLVRTSRSVSLTPEGEAFLAHCRDALRAVQTGREEATESRRQPHGEVHLTLSPVVGPALVPSLARLRERHPALAFRVTVTDRLVRLVEEGIDVAVRLGAPEDSGLVGRTLSRPRWATVAAPAYVARHGLPASPEDLAGHAALRFVAPDGRPKGWSFRDPQSRATRTMAVDGPLLVDQGERLLDACVAGMGICQVLDFMVEDHVRSGHLVEVLGAWAAPGPEIHALYPPERSRSPNVRAVVDFLVEVFAVRSGRS